MKKRKDMLSEVKDEQKMQIDTAIKKHVEIGISTNKKSRNKMRTGAHHLQCRRGDGKPPCARFERVVHSSYAASCLIEVNPSYWKRKKKG
jgi:hypothetical protein